MSIPSLRNRVNRLEQADASAKVVGIVARKGESRAAINARVREAHARGAGVVYVAHLLRSEG